MRFNNISDVSNHIIDNFMIRKSKKQKTEFIEYLSCKLGFDVRVEKSGSSRNIVVGNLESAKYVFTAHYDTCATLFFIPNFLTPKNIFIFILYQLFLTVLMLGIALGVGALAAVLTGFINPAMSANVFSIGFIVTLFLIIFQMMVGYRNKNNYNDNTSGVVTLVELMKRMPEKYLNDVCFVFFDNEEKGLLGSQAFNKMHKKLMNEKLLFNFDCVSDGDYFLFVYKRLDQVFIDKLYKCFNSSNKHLEIIKASKAIYPSDQKSFKNGVGIAAFNKGKRIGLYMNKIHTKKDVVFEEENINLLVRTFLKFVCGNDFELFDNENSEF